MLEEIKEELIQLSIHEEDEEKLEKIESILHKVVQANNYYKFKIHDMESYINKIMLAELEKNHDTIEKDS